MEVFDIRSSNVLNDKYKEKNLADFYRILLDDQYRNLKDYARSFISGFDTTHVCEKKIFNK